MSICLVKEREKSQREKQGKKKKRENLVAGRRKRKKDLIPPMIFVCCLNAVGFEGWLEQYLLPSLEIKSVLIMDNAPIRTKNAD